MYRVKLHHLHRNVKFIVMSSVFDTDKVISSFYDLKGSIEKRQAKEGDSVQKCNNVRNMIENDPSTAFLLHHEVRVRLREQIVRDCGFLQEMNIYDYSMLMGVHYIPYNKSSSIEGYTFRRTRSSFDRLDSFSHSPLIKTPTRHNKKASLPATSDASNESRSLSSYNECYSSEQDLLDNFSNKNLPKKAHARHKRKLSMSTSDAFNEALSSCDRSYDAMSTSDALSSCNECYSAETRWTIPGNTTSIRSNTSRVAKKSQIRSSLKESSLFFHRLDHGHHVSKSESFTDPSSSLSFDELKHRKVSFSLGRETFKSLHKPIIHEIGDTRRRLFAGSEDCNRKVFSVGQSYSTLSKSIDDSDCIGSKKGENSSRPVEERNTSLLVSDSEINYEEICKKELAIEKNFWPFHRYYEMNGQHRMRPIPETFHYKGLEDESASKYENQELKNFDEPLSNRKDGGLTMDVADLTLPLNVTIGKHQQKCEGKIFYLGIIDILTQYTEWRKLEAQYKRLRRWNQPSCVNPEKYADRFVIFFDEYTSSTRSSTNQK
mmetsp:Transcript_21720/g.26634  ORF Transcript_21720/g.26634 Transcript_21720/m.26634 type:complete len:545 (+) Transcript_21720:763-2397(+)